MAGKEGDFSHRFRLFLRQERAALSTLVFAVGVLLSILALADFTPLGTAGPFPAIQQATDQSGSGGPNYNLAFVVAGPIIAILGAYLVGAYFVARRKFDHLMETRSKAEFLRNLPEIEELLWDLTPADEHRYEEKIGELRIRR
jgi:hypothetical protein